MKILFQQIISSKIEKKIKKILSCKENKNQLLRPNLYQPSQDWKITDFECLAELINQVVLKTHYKKISVSTLQRIFGKKDKNTIFEMQTKTKNTITFFLDYENWESLENAFFNLLTQNILLDKEARIKISQILSEKT